MAITANPNANEIPSSPMPEGPVSATPETTAAPQPKRTRQNVPMNSAIKNQKTSFNKEFFKKICNKLISKSNSKE